jgi:hypothetical protein
MGIDVGREMDGIFVGDNVGKDDVGDCIGVVVGVIVGAALENDGESVC